MPNQHRIRHAHRLPRWSPRVDNWTGEALQTICSLGIVARLSGRTKHLSHFSEWAPLSIRLTNYSLRSLGPLSWSTSNPTAACNAINGVIQEAVRLLSRTILSTACVIMRIDHFQSVTEPADPLLQLDLCRVVAHVYFLCSQSDAYSDLRPSFFLRHQAQDVRTTVQGDVRRPIAIDLDWCPSSVITLSIQLCAVLPAEACPYVERWRVPQQRQQLFERFAVGAGRRRRQSLLDDPRLHHQEAT